MLRRTPMRRTAWPSRAPASTKAAPRLVECAQAAIKKIVKSTAVLARITNTDTIAFQKTPVGRNRALLDMARGRECLLRVPGVCQGGTETTVAAHSNWACHGGKGMGRKASDAYVVNACFACHSWLDQGPAPKAEKQMAFLRAHADQVQAWRRIERDPSETTRTRNAARWALEQLNSTTQGQL